HRLRLVADRPALGDVLVADDLRKPLLRLHLHQRRRRRRLAVVDVPDRAHVHVRLVADEFLLGHDCRLLRTLEGCRRGSVTGLEPTTGLEPVTSSLPRKCSTTELGGRAGGRFLAGAMPSARFGCSPYGSTAARPKRAAGIAAASDSAPRAFAWGSGS